MEILFAAHAHCTHGARASAKGRGLRCMVAIFQPQSVCSVVDCLLSTEVVEQPGIQTGVSEVTVSDVGSADGMK